MTGAPDVEAGPGHLAAGWFPFTTFATRVALRSGRVQLRNSSNGGRKGDVLKEILGNAGTLKSVSFPGGFSRGKTKT